jgi:UDP-N-acetylglucosamine diphosphorylase / glucose-1-phosphate thymidylyltransferase / UDP-N-acetylgalactosamine diphosphorylase / glucosamine-1-phosphate N-acetyltransferase / galactosamine-1-phosphate N-acetyltransferase
MLISIIFAGGKGTRLLPLTETIPKPLLKAGNMPLIQWNMERVVPHVNKFVIVISYHGQDIIDYFGENFKGVPIEYVWQNNPKGGTLDALRTALHESDSVNIKADYLIQNCDDIHGKQTFEKVFNHIYHNPSLACLTARIIESKEKLKSFGVFKVTSDNMFLEVIEKPQEFISHLANIAISYFPNKVIQFVPRLIDTTEKEAYITDMYNDYSEMYPIQVLSTTDIWLPITSITDLEYADEYVRNHELV